LTSNLPSTKYEVGGDKLESGPSGVDWGPCQWGWDIEGMPVNGDTPISPEKIEGGYGCDEGVGSGEFEGKCESRSRCDNGCDNDCDSDKNDDVELEADASVEVMVGI
jgi:hypothetical protein